MTTPPEEKKTPLKLSGANGNAFMVMALAQCAAKKAGWSDMKIAAYARDARSGDYDHLLQVTMEYFNVS